MRYAPISAAGLPPTWGWSAMRVSWPSSSLKRCPSDRSGRSPSMARLRVSSSPPLIRRGASIGLGFGAALGAAKARPDKTTVLVVGDGGLLMTMGEIETVVREDLPIVIVLMNDCAYGAELHFLRLRQQPVTKSVFPDVDFAPIAESFGFEAATIRTLEDLHKLAAKLRKPDGPIFLDCKINAEVAAPFMSEFAQFEGRH